MQNMKNDLLEHREVVSTGLFRLIVKSCAIFAFVLVQSLSASAQTNGYFTALLRSECTSAPTNPPPVGAIRVGPDYVIMTVGLGDPANFNKAQQLATDAVFESLMPLYCSLLANPSAGCVENRVQWDVEVYNASGDPHISGCAASGCQFHYFTPPCSVTPSEEIQFLITWVNVDVAAGILAASDGDRLTATLNDVLSSASKGNGKPSDDKLEQFIREVNHLVRAGKLPATAGQTLTDGANAITTP